MKDGLLESIIQLEQQIQADVAAEQQRAGEWQQRELAALQAWLEIARETEKSHFREALQEKQAELQHEGETLEAASVAWCERLSTIDDAALLEVLKMHLAVILPGGDHDHPHGQG